MKKIFLASSILAVLLMSGCGNPLSNPSQYKVDNKKVIVAYTQPAKEYKCKKIKKGTPFNPNVKVYLGFIKIGPSTISTQALADSHFSQEAAKAGANYVDREFYSIADWYWVYGESEYIEATYYKCKTLPTPKLLKKYKISSK